MKKPAHFWLLFTSALICDSACVLPILSTLLIFFDACSESASEEELRGKSFNRREYNQSEEQHRKQECQ